MTEAEFEDMKARVLKSMEKSMRVVQKRAWWVLKDYLAVNPDIEIVRDGRGWVTDGAGVVPAIDGSVFSVAAARTRRRWSTETVELTMTHGFAVPCEHDENGRVTRVRKPRPGEVTLK